jgi:hypothetical protein
MTEDFFKFIFDTRKQEACCNREICNECINSPSELIYTFYSDALFEDLKEGTAFSVINSKNENIIGSYVPVKDNKDGIYLKIKPIVNNAGRIYNAINLDNGTPAYFVPRRGVFLSSKYSIPKNGLSKKEG